MRVTFSPQPDGTQVSVDHECSDVAGDGENLRLGWEDVLARLAQTVR